MSQNIKAPSTIGGIKHLARAIKTTRNVPHVEALDLASKQGGFENYRHAHRVLSVSNHATTEHVRPAQLHLEYVSLSADWGKPGSLVHRETITLRLSRPSSEFLDARTRRVILGSFKRKGSNHFHYDTVLDTEASARWSLCKAARFIQFVEATGLSPATSRQTQSIKVDSLPHRDHCNYWVHRATGAVVFTDEPYLNAVKDEDQERKSWAAKNNVLIEQSPWAGMHNPLAGSGTQLYLLTASANELVLNSIVGSLRALPKPILEADWGVQFRHWSIETSSINRRAPSELTTRIKNAAPYAMVMTGRRVRPAGRMPLDAHTEISDLIKSVLAIASYRRGVLKNLESLRCELDDWLQCEYPGEQELPSDKFHSMYYGHFNSLSKRSIALTEQTEAVRSMTRVKQLLEAHYPSAKPLHEVLRRLDGAMKSLLGWKASES